MPPCSQTHQNDPGIFTHFEKESMHGELTHSFTSENKMLEGYLTTIKSLRKSDFLLVILTKTLVHILVYHNSFVPERQHGIRDFTLKRFI